jgi:hypothetical protein
LFGRVPAGIIESMSGPKKKPKPNPKRKPAKTPVNKAIETTPENKAYGEK